ncbi:hypothetical protein MKQ68_13220 [Chitinophaga horti]|uniref:DUF445 domain-containing protein n=1 Tax=Chitinophaga horti TaxID=2920382 RepID=A0ABY6IUK6_9BACT|nr:hypothetical protein [Chitinophaga horti]UYQ91054.1 hypothetical protein MKQ68_13220 [Chitinophaga horti]
MPIYIIPIVTAIAGWLAILLAVKFLFRSILPKKQPELAAKLGHMVATELFSFSAIRAKLTDPEKITAIMPYVETHLDHFLKEKLPKAMPVLSMFIGDSTISQIKGTLVTELHTLFPKIIDQYLQNAEKDFDLENVISRKVNEVSIPAIEKAISKEVNKLAGFGALVGLGVGAIYLAITMLIP